MVLTSFIAMIVAPYLGTAANTPLGGLARTSVRARAIPLRRPLRAPRACRSLARMRARLTALLSAVLMAVLWASPQSIEYLCSMSGERRATCCCGPDSDHAETTEVQLERQGCCEIERSHANVSPALAPTPDDADQVATAFGLSGEYEHDGGCTAPEFVPTLARGPPQAIGPPAYLRNCRFLI